VLELQKILGDEKGIGTTLGNLGNLRADAGEWDRAKAYYLEALDLMCKTHDEAGKAVLFSDLGLVARETKEFEQAIGYYEQSLVLMRRLGNEGGVADAWRMLGRTFLLQQRYDDAIACCQTSQSIAERSCDELRTGGARYVLVQCYEETGKLREAADLLELVVHMDRKYQLPKLQENIQRLAGLRARLLGQDEAPPHRRTNV
jgi:tetratricopeptide (TPR) repeat protein